MSRMVRLLLVGVIYVNWCRWIVAEKPPNIIIILADDLGHDDVSFRGSKQIPTPNLDALAYDGVILDNFYVQRICTPSRAALMTGRHPIQLGLQHGVILGAEKYGLGLNETLLPEYLQTLGYSTHVIGKWHLGFFAKEYTPTFRGFDSFYGFYQGREDYYDHTFKMGDSQWGLDLRNNMDIVKSEFGQYGTEIFTREAERVINDHDPSKPLFLYFPQQGVHVGNEETKTPLEAPWKYVRKFAHINEKQRQIYAGMVSAVDDSVGNVTRALHAKGMLNNTVIFFSTDNGGPAHGFDKNQACNWPLRGMKYTLWEGGVRAASFMWSPKLQNSPYVSRHMMQIEDVFATLLHAAGYDTTKLPRDIYGKDMWDALSQNTPSPRAEMLHNIDEQTGVKGLRVDDMKLVMSGKNGLTAKYDSWYSPPQYTATESINHRMIRYDGNLHQLSQNPQSEMAKILESLGRPHRTPKPVLIQCGPRPQNASVCNGVDHPCLYNVTADPCEFKDLAKGQPEVVGDLLKRLNYYQGEAAPPKNKPVDPKGFPKYHGGVWEPWIVLSQMEVSEMKRGKVL